jgi:hypothetical protein
MLGTVGPAAAPAQAAETSASRPTASTESAQSVKKTKGLQLLLNQVTPSALTAQDQLVVNGAVRNSSNKMVKNLTVSLRFGYTALSGKSGVSDWVDDGDVSTTSTVLDTVTLKNVPAKGLATFRLTRAAGSIGLASYTSSFGPRPIALVATSGLGKQLSVLRSTVVWAPEGSEQKVGLTLLAPLTSAVPSSTAGLPTEEAAAELLPGSRLSRVLDASTDPAIGWAVDPALLAAAKALKDGGISESTDEASDPTPTPTKPSASPGPGPTPSKSSSATGPVITVQDAKAAGTTWLNRITSGRTNRSVIGLSYADADLNSLLKGGLSTDLLRQSDQLGQAVEKETLGKTLPWRIAWPADGVISNDAIQGLGQTRHRSVILSEAQQPPASDLDYTPSGKSTLRRKDSTLTGLLYDQDLSDLFAKAGQDPSAQTTQTLLAELAAISAEAAPGQATRQVLAVAPRNWDPQPGRVQALTTALRQSSWVQLSSLKKLGEADSVDRKRHAYGTKATAKELPTGNLSNALAMDRDLDNVAPALIDNQDVVRRLQQRIASLLSFAWRSDLDAQADARRSVMDDVDALAGGVQLLVGSQTKTFTARSAPIQVTVDNKTDYAVRVSVSFRTGSGQLKIDQQPTAVTVAANHRQSFRVEARAIATGDVMVETKLLTGEGASQRVLGDPQTFEVKVRPNWESWGMIGMAVILGFLLLIGLLRSFRRNRKRPKVPLNTVPDVDDEATRAARRSAAREALERQAIPTPILRSGEGDETDGTGHVTQSAADRASGGATNRSPQGSSQGGDLRRAPGAEPAGPASGDPGGSRGMHEQKSSSVSTMAAKGAERRNRTLPKENR